MLLCTQVFASKDIFLEVEKSKLYNHSYFKKLLHYRNSKSEIDSTNFFVSKNGKYNTQEELIETIKALKSGEKKVLCRFPLRVKWLKEQLPELKNQIKEYECKDLKEFISLNNAKHLTLVFPTAHINSPASMYGHTFLRLVNDIKTPLISNAVNYAAKSDEKNGFVFAYEGIFGGYEGRYSILPYYKKIKEYNNLEQRDVWEYDLDFTKEEIKDIVLHTYELKDSYANYYFFLENCSYNVLWFLEIAKAELELIDKFKLKAIPLDTIKVLKPYNLIKNTNYRHSKMQKMKYILNNEVKDPSLLKKYLEAKDEKLLKNLSQKEKLAYLDFKIEYTQYIRSKNKLNEKTYISQYLRLLRLRSKIKEKSTYNIKKPFDPILSHDSAKLAFTYSSDDSKELSIKPAYNDIYDISDGYLQGAYIDFFQIKIKKNKKRTFLDEFVFLNIESLSQRDEIFKPLSWGINLAYKHFKNEKDYVYLKPEFGVTYGNKKNFISFLAHNEMYYKNSKNFYTLGTSIKAISNEFKTYKLASVYTYNRIDEDINNNIYEVFLTKKINKDLSLNLKYKKDDFYTKDNEIFSYSFYYYF